MAKKKSSIHIKSSHEGKLHRALGVPAGQKLTSKELDRAAHSRNPAVRREAVFAENARTWSRSRKSS